jgi:hypothetical protein
LRGKPGTSTVTKSGTNTLSTSNYEHVTISESKGRDISYITVTFKDSWSPFFRIDEFALRAKYDPPMDRETFTVWPGIEMIVDFGPAKQVCRIHLPSGIDTGGNMPDGVVSKLLIDNVLEEVVPSSTRGKALDQGIWAFGAALVPSSSETKYEQVTISEFKIDGVGTGITVTFNYSGCPRLTAK